jgi:hypothetical protein
VKVPKLASALGAIVLVAACGATIVGCGGCPAALLEGHLAEESGELVVTRGEDVASERVIWPFGYGVRREGDELVLADILGTVKGRPGDTVRLGGGEVESGTFKVCGMLEVIPQPPA